MRVDILTLFPETVSSVLHESILGRACKKGILEINAVQIRDYTENKQRQVDDYPYGGGWGCVMMAQPLKSCLDAVLAASGEKKRRVIYMSPQGQPFTQAAARRLRDYEQLILVCGHYEGVDERFIEECVDEELSLGDFVLTGGEIAAMAVTDAVCRLVPGVLSDEECYTGESHWDGLLEYPQYTRPETWEGRRVPEVLLEGNHAHITRWRRKQQLLRTRDKRPDLFEKLSLTEKEDLELLREVKKEEGRPAITLSLSCLPLTEADLPAVMEIVRDASEGLRRHGVDQWQDGYPDEAVFLADIARGECFKLLHGEELVAVFTLTRRPDDNYLSITDGKWAFDGPYCSLHRCAVARRWRGTGMADKMLFFVQEQARAWGYMALRSDTHKKNKPMQRLLRENGFRYRGNITVKVRGEHDTARQAYEKLLKERK